MKRDNRLETLADEIVASMGESKVNLVRADDIEPEAINWLWPDWIAAGKLHILAGPPGAGKTTVALKLGATVSTGEMWPDGARATAGGVIIWSGEDGIADTLRPRIEVADADMRRVHFISGVSDHGEHRPFDPATDVQTLRDAFKSLPEPPSLLIVDPIVSAVSGDSHKNTEVRRALQPLVDLARETGCAVLGITHFSKGTRGRDPVERVTGSIAFGAVARVVIGFAKLPDDHEKSPGRIMVRVKSNIGKDEGGFVYELLQHTLPGHADITATAVKWI